MIFLLWLRPALALARESKFRKTASEELTLFCRGHQAEASVVETEATCRLIMKIWEWRIFSFQFKDYPFSEVVWLCPDCILAEEFCHCKREYFYTMIFSFKVSCTLRGINLSQNLLPRWKEGNNGSVSCSVVRLNSILVGTGGTECLAGSVV